MRHFSHSIFLSILLSLLLHTTVLGQEDKPKKEKGCGCPYDQVELDNSFFDEPLFTAEEKPHFSGGDPALKIYIERLIQHPAKNATDSAKYHVFSLFVVEKDGTITHPTILHPSDSIFNHEAQRFIETMPKWIPGRTNGEAVRCWHSIKLYFGYHTETNLTN